MAVSLPELDVLYPDLDEEKRIDRFESLKAGFAANIERCNKRAQRGGATFIKKVGVVETGENLGSKIDEMRTLEKSLTGDAKAALTGAIDALEKDWTTSNPLSVAPFASYNMGLVPYDLQPDLLMLLPRFLRLRGSIPREQGMGTATEYRRILGVTETNTGGVADTSPFFNSESTTTSFGSLSLRRPAKISYAADHQVRPYVESGFSDEVTYKQQFAGRPVVDTQALSQIAATLADMIGEEKALLNARGAGSLFTGKTNLTSVTATPSAVSGSGFTSGHTYHVYVTFVTSVGESAVVDGSTVGPSGGNLAVKVIVGGVTAVPNGTLGAYVYFVDTSASNNTTRQFVQAASTLLGTGVTFTSPGTQYGAANTDNHPTTDSSAYGIPGGTYTADGYDGLVAIATDPTQSGYVGRVDGALGTTDPGAEWETLFGTLWNAVIADPDETLMTGTILARLFAIIQASGSSTGWRLNYDPVNGGSIGGFVSGIVNRYTGKVVDAVAHPYLPSGVSVVRSKSLPNLGASGISNIEAVRNVVDLTLFDWPEIQMTKDVSTYKYGVFEHYAPAWIGSLVGITG